MSSRVGFVDFSQNLFCQCQTVYSSVDSCFGLLVPSGAPVMMEQWSTVVMGLLDNQNVTFDWSGEDGAMGQLCTGAAKPSNSSIIMWSVMLWGKIFGPCLSHNVLFYFILFHCVILSHSVAYSFVSYLIESHTNSIRFNSLIVFCCIILTVAASYSSRRWDELSLHVSSRNQTDGALCVLHKSLCQRWLNEGLTNCFSVSDHDGGMKTTAAFLSLPPAVGER